MKDQLLDNHRQTVAAVDLKSAPTKEVPGDIKTSTTGTTAATNFDDDYNEWELGIGELIIDLDADIEKNNCNSNIVYGATDGTGALTLTSARSPPSGGMSNSKTSRMNVPLVKAGDSSVSTSAGESLNIVKNSATGAEHQATVDKGLKMKIKRKNVGSKSSEAKHEIVQSDTKSHSLVDNTLEEDINSPGVAPDTKSKHNIGKVRSGIHREKKERPREKEKNNKANEINGVVSNLSSLAVQASGTGVNFPTASAPSVNQGVATSVLTLTNTTSVASSISGVSSVSSVMGAPCFACPTVKLENSKNPMVSLKNAQNPSEGDGPKTAPLPKRIKIETMEKMEEVLLPPAVKDNSTCTSVSTWTDPECLGPCEPGTSVLLEGIVWQETEEGVLVVNVTWRDKTYVGTLLDCTKYDWAPPRLCESPTDEVDSKAPKVRAKRGRGSSNSASDLQSSETRTAIQSKLRKGKGRRGTVSSTSSSSEFTVPHSPTKSDNGTSGHGKRKGRSADVELGSSDQKSCKRSRSQTQASPTPVNSSPSDFVQPLSPVLLECPEPNCNKKYKHINGLRFHQSHAHANLEVTKTEDSNFEESKEMVNSSDNDESFQDSLSVPTSPTSYSRNSPAFRPSQSTDTPASNITPEEEHSVTSVGLTFIPVNNSSTEVSSVLTVMNRESNQSLDQSRIASSHIPFSTNSGICTSVTNGQFSVVAPVVSSANAVTVITTVSIPTSHVPQFGLPTVANTAVVSSISASIPSTGHITEHGPSPGHILTVTSLSSSSSTPYLSDKRHTEEIVEEESTTTSSSARTSNATAVMGHILTVEPIVSSTLHFQNQKNPNALPSPLKPIQPKPTGLGETSTINTALENFKREKIKHKKKSKDKEKIASLHVTFSEGLTPNHDIINSTLSAGLKTEPIQGDKENGLTSMSCDSSSSCLSPRLSAPSGMTSDAVEEINENVQSPAYSDISDANDSNLLDDHLQEEKGKSDKILLQQRNGSNQSSEQGLNPIYPYYSPPQYLSPSVPSQCSEITPVSAVDKTHPKEDKLDVTAWLENAKRVSPEEVVSKDIRNHKISRESSSHSSSTAVTPPIASVQDYSVQQQFSYPYNMIPGYHYRVDSAYHLHLLSTDPRYKQQYEVYIREQEKLKKKLKASHQNEKNDGKETRILNDKPVSMSSFRATDLTLAKTVSSSTETNTNDARRDARISSFHEVVRSLTPPSIGQKEKRNESHKIMKENTELKDNVKTNQYDTTAVLEQHQEEMRRFYMMHLAEQHNKNVHLAEQHNKNVHLGEQHNKNGEQPQQHRISSHQSETTKSGRSGSASSGKQISFEDSNKLDITSKGDLNKPASSIASTSSPKGSSKDLSKHFSREHKINSCSSHNMKKEDNSYTSKHQNSDDKIKIEKKQNSEGQKPTMETTGPPPPPTNSYAYLHPSYLQAPPHFGHMTFDPKHPMYRGGLNPLLVSPNPHYVGPAFIHSQLRYPVPGTSCEIPSHSQSPNDHLGLKLHHTPPPKALDYLHQVSQQYTNHKIHELQGPTSSTSGTSASQSKPVDSPSTVIKQEPARSSDRSRSPPLQRHLHTHHHTHVGVGYPLYDPYGAIIASHQGAAGSVVPI
ncbi:zinc finger protein 608-like isoform X2 [Limulus polyphemus]|uniref:Zinc finger protein 608-like isoform X2 n=1 Tax=Limulus polyphemus TaxID=6850 RepID=A0ABM1TMZ5_LIMPO|nr:zinc finger protein 608-like isoform X2 [Limulus polyphemus]